MSEPHRECNELFHPARGTERHEQTGVRQNSLAKPVEGVTLVEVVHHSLPIRTNELVSTDILT